MMKKILALVLCLNLGGCISIPDFFSGIKTATVGISNPVTKDMLYDLENGAIIAFAGLGAYKRSCVGGAIPESCRKTIASIQVYTRQIKIELPLLRSFVKNNDQVNAVLVYNQIMAMIAAYKSIATSNNIQVQ